MRLFLGHLLLCSRARALWVDPGWELIQHPAPHPGALGAFLSSSNVAQGGRKQTGAPEVTVVTEWCHTGSFLAGRSGAT